MDFKVIDIHHVSRNGESPLKAFVKVAIGPCVVSGFRIIYQDGKPVLSMPVVSFRDAFSGRVVYRELLTFPSANDKQELEVEILSAWKKEREKWKQHAQ